MTAIPAILTATPAITLPATAAIETLNHANVELGLVDNVGDRWAGAHDDEEPVCSSVTAGFGRRRRHDQSTLSSLFAVIHLCCGPKSYET